MQCQKTIMNYSTKIMSLSKIFYRVIFLQIFYKFNIWNFFKFFVACDKFYFVLQSKNIANTIEKRQVLFFIFLSKNHSFYQNFSSNQVTVRFKFFIPPCCFFPADISQ